MLAQAAHSAEEHAGRTARAIVATWTIVERVNGVGHPLWSLVQGAYTPGVGTAPVLFVLAVWVARELRAAPEGGRG